MSAAEYYNPHYIQEGILFLRAKTAAELNAMTPPPPSPFTVDVTVTMTNDAGQTASGTITFETTYNRAQASASASQSAAPATTPAFRDPGTVTAAPGATLTYRATDLFDNAGAGARITVAGLNPGNYYTIDETQFDRGVLQVDVMTAAALSALSTPPDSPFTVDATVTMTNDAGQTASGSFTFQTTYDRVSAPEENAGPTGPVLVQTFKQLAAGITGWIRADTAFDHAGTNPRITEASFSSMEYFDTGHTYIVQSRPPFRLALCAGQDRRGTEERPCPRRRPARSRSMSQ